MSDKARHTVLGAIAVFFILVIAGSCALKAGFTMLEEAREWRRQVELKCADVDGRDYRGCISRETMRRRLE